MVPVVDVSVSSSGAQAERLGERDGDFIVGKGGAGGISLALIFHQIGIAAKVRFFFEEQEIAFLQEVGRRQPAHAAAYDDDIMVGGDGRAREHFSVAHLVADLVLFTLDAGRGFGGRSK